MIKDRTAVVHPHFYFSSEWITWFRKFLNTSIKIWRFINDSLHLALYTAAVLLWQHGNVLKSLLPYEYCSIIVTFLLILHQLYSSWQCDYWFSVGNEQKCLTPVLNIFTRSLGLNMVNWLLTHIAQTHTHTHIYAYIFGIHISNVHTLLIYRKCCFYKHP